jgi:two-component system CheB/CheR fusion protein
VELDREGLAIALEHLAERTRQVFRIGCTFECENRTLVQDRFSATHLYRIAQEAVNNAIKHGKARRILIALRDADQRVRLNVEDDGIGIDPNVQDRVGMGIRNMRYRARMIGGKLEVARKPSGGTAVSCTKLLSAPRGSAP